MSLRFALWRERTLRSHPDVTKQQLEDLYAASVAKIDQKALDTLALRNRRAARDIVEACDYRLKLRIASLKALTLGLHSALPARILDIGSGGGYFVTECRHPGHDAHGTEVPTSRLNNETAAAYREIGQALQWEPKRLLIQAHTPIELTTSYDLITAHKITFNDYRKPTEWGVSQWQFFVQDALRLLTPGGHLVLDLNENVEKYGVRRWYSSELRDFFGSIGSVTQNRIVIGHRRNDRSTTAGRATAPNCMLRVSCVHFA